MLSRFLLLSSLLLAGRNGSILGQFGYLMLCIQIPVWHVTYVYAPPAIFASNGSMRVLRGGGQCASSDAEMAT